MANTFLAAQGHDVGKSLQEKDLHATALEILKTAQEKGCDIVLPKDVVVAKTFAANVPTEVVGVDAIPADSMALDVGPATVAAFIKRLPEIKTIIWNGPLGAFETKPFDASTNELAEAIAKATDEGKIVSVGGGGDTVSALKLAGVHAPHELSLQRRRRLPGMDGRQDPAGRGSAERRPVEYWLGQRKGLLFVNKK